MKSPLHFEGDFSFIPLTLCCVSVIIKLFIAFRGFCFFHCVCAKRLFCLPAEGLFRQVNYQNIDKIYRTRYNILKDGKGGRIMIDFKNASYFKLKPVDNSAYSNMICPMFVSDEAIIATFKGIRDGVVFTNKRIFAINVQGLTGTKKDFTSLPYSKIQAFSVETAGLIDLDSELELWFSGLGKVKFEFVSKADVSDICQMISERVL